ncbi:hypothetical protein PCANC_10778 [Puccinia coronata f. sp. avenae]|nr:hypothetical protein PCANC_10778 [Puccinia coronata f. sp. avenae]
MSSVVNLWNALSPELLSRHLVATLPEDPLQYASLSHNNSQLNLQTLTLLIKKSTVRRPVSVDLTYKHPEDNIPTDLNTKRSTSIQTSTSRTLHTTCWKKANQANAGPIHKSKPVGMTSISTDGKWALGGTAATMPARGNVSLSTQTNFLGKRLSN